MADNDFDLAKELHLKLEAVKQAAAMPGGGSRGPWEPCKDAYGRLQYYVHAVSRQVASGAGGTLYKKQIGYSGYKSAVARDGRHHDCCSYYLIA